MEMCNIHRYFLLLTKHVLCRNIKILKVARWGLLSFTENRENSLCAVSIDIARYGAVIVLHFTKLG